MTITGLYIHIPWCHTRCIYCDFNTYIDGSSELKQRYHVALLREIRETGAVLGRPRLETIFFGGGTPTTLDPGELISLVEAVRAAFVLDARAEITTEANPGTLTTSYLRELREGGFNRLSLGVQSFDDDELRFLSRLHDAETARRAVEMARKAGFDNLSLDLIFNLPRQSLPAWRANIDEAVRLAPEHLSLYSLIVEPGTPLYKQVMSGLVPSPDDDVAADMYAYTMDALGSAGYGHYEISNWARVKDEAEWQTPHLAAQHNLIYWRAHDYAGIGAGAFGTLGGQRWGNVRRPQRYIALVESGSGLGMARDPATEETVTQESGRSEAIMMGLRLVREGICAADFEGRFHVDFDGRFAEPLRRGLERGLLEWIESPEGKRLRLTPHARFIANEAILPFFS